MTRFGLRAFLTASSLMLGAALPILAMPREAFAQKGGGHEDITLAIGETRTLSAAGVREYSEGVKGIIDVVTPADGKTFILTGRKEGTTPGVGLGLAICRAIMQAHGGSIRGETRTTGGASFLLTLPRGEPPSDDGGASEIIEPLA